MFRVAGLGLPLKFIMSHNNRTKLFTAYFTGIALFAVAFLGAQEQRPGPAAPPPEHHVTRLSVQPAAPPPPVPPEEIIKHFSQKEEEFRQARPAYTSKKIIRLQEFSDDGTVLGEYQLTIEPAVNSSGKPYEKVVDQTSSLKVLHFEPEDLGRMLAMPAFVLTPAQLTKYNLTYVGKEQVDELNCYMFRVKPKQVERTHNYFEGLVWVDDRDLAVVKTYGKWINETGDVRMPELPFTYLETYRENTAGKFWFPNYTRSDDSVRLKDREVRTRMTIRWSNLMPSSGVTKNPSPPAPPAPPASATPPAKGSAANHL